MKIKNLLPVALLTVLAVLLALAVHAPNIWKDRNTVTVGIASGQGYTVTSQNPVTVSRGEDVRFDITVEEGYFFRGVESGTYENGQIVIHAPQRSRSIYPHIGKYCNISAVSSGHGTVELLTAPTVLDGETASVKITPDEHYVVERITVGGREYPVPADNVLSFTVQDDSNVQVEFAGKSLTFMAMTGNLGSVSIQNETDDYRYGDVLQLRCQFDGTSIKFNGWSTGNFLQDGGTLLSEEPDLDYTITADSILYANFTDRSTFWVRYDANAGQMQKNPEQEYSPGEYIHTAQDRDYFVRDGYCLLEYNTKADGTGQRYGLGAMLEMPRWDITLYAQWAKETDASLLTYTASGGSITVTGLSQAGKAAGLTQLVIPKTINGTKVTAIGSNAFRDCASLQQAVIPLGVKSIGSGAFSRCTALTTVYFPESLTSMSSDVLSGSTNFTTMRILSNLDMAFDYDYDSALADRYMRLKNTAGKRLILVAGSSMSFGLNSEMLAQRFPDYTVINFSCSVYYGITPLFDMLRENTHEGDIVVFAPEYYSYMYGNTRPESIYNWQYLESNYDILEDLNMQNNPTVFNFFVEYLNEKRGYLPDKKVNANNVYIRTGFNTYGDLITFRTNASDLGFSGPSTGVLQELGMGLYNATCQQLTQQGVRCLFSFPPNPSGGSSKADIAAQTNTFQTKLVSMLDSRYCTVISNVADYYFPSNLFYDNKYHMTMDGAKVRTEQLIADLEHYITD